MSSSQQSVVQRKLADGEKEALLQFIQGPDGASWQRARSGWDASSDDVCSWTGIKCDSDNSVSEINLQNTRLTASIPQGLGSLTSLTHLYLSGNNMFGEVPSRVADLPNLVHVDLSVNSFRGEVPIFTSVTLEVLNLSHNSFSGTLPENFGSRMALADNLKVLDFKYNRIGGSIPSSIENLTPKLGEFDLSSNRLQGQIPDAIGQLVNLEGLFLSNNRLSGPIPPSITRSNVALSQVFLQGNKLSGTLPASFADLPNLQNLFIDGNKLTGSVPPELCNNDLNSIFFQDSLADIRGGDSDYDDDAKPKNEDETYDEDVLAMEAATLDESEEGKALLINGTSVPVYKSGAEDAVGDGRQLQASTDDDCSDSGCERNGCNSIACPAGYESTSTGKDGVFPCRKCHHDYVNPYIGASSCFMLDQHEIMKSFYNATKGEKWVGVYSGWGDESVPVCQWPGIACNDRDDIISIVLPNSNLHGTIPPNLGFLRRLEVFDVSDNFLTGEIPSELHYAPLEVLDLSGNALEGSVPPILCEKQGINGNGRNGVFSCEKIACPIGSFSTTGRGGGKDGECVPCATGADYLAMKACGPAFETQASSAGSPQKKAGAIFGVIFVSVLSNMFLCCGFLLFRRQRKMINDIHDLTETDDFVDPEDDVPTAYITKTEPAPTNPFPMNRSTFVDAAETDHFNTMSMPRQSRNAWSGGKEPQTEVWLDVPKIN